MPYLIDPATYVETRASVFGSMSAIWCDGCQEYVAADTGCETPTGFACPDCKTDFWLEA
jgi:hypothetical protein